MGRSEQKLTKETKGGQRDRCAGLCDVAWGRRPDCGVDASQCRTAGNAFCFCCAWVHSGALIPSPEGSAFENVSDRNILSQRSSCRVEIGSTNGGGVREH